MYYKCLYSSVIPELDMESMFIPLDSSLRWNDINILDASRYIRDTTLGARRKLATTEVAKDYLLALLYLLRRARLLTLLLLIDEVEYVFSQMMGAKVANVFNTLRDLYDLPQSPRALEFGQPLANVIFFFGISRAGWTRVNDLEKREQRRGGPIQPFLDRKEEVIELQPLDLADARELIDIVK